MQQPGGQTCIGEHRFQMGGPGTTSTPLATALAQIQVVEKQNNSGVAFMIKYYSAIRRSFADMIHHDDVSVELQISYSHETARASWDFQYAKNFVPVDR